MEWVVVAVLAFLVFATTLVCLAVLIARNRVNRRHRVDPAVATDAPLTWLVDPRAPARLHRRLARVGTLATAVVDDHQAKGRRRKKAEPSPMATAAQDLRIQAVALDRQLSRLSVLAPTARRRPLIDLARAIDEIEVAGARLVALSTQVRAPRDLVTDEPALQELTSRLDHLAQAHRELLDLDADAGLAARTLPAPPLVRPAPTPAPAAAPAPPGTGTGTHGRAADVAAQRPGRAPPVGSPPWSTPSSCSRPSRPTSPRWPPRSPRSTGWPRSTRWPATWI